MNKDNLPYFVHGALMLLAACIAFKIPKLAQMGVFVFGVGGVVVLLSMAVSINKLTDHDKDAVKRALEVKEHTLDFRKRMWIMSGLTVLMIAAGGNYIIAGLWALAVISVTALTNCQLKIKRIADELNVDVTLTVEELAEQIIASVKQEAPIEKGEQI